VEIAAKNCTMNIKKGAPAQALDAPS